MRAYIAFVKKECIENIRTYKAFIMAAVFLLFGFMSPALAKLTPEIAKMSKIQMTIPTPTALDSWAQFFKNVGQLGLIVLVVVFCGLMAHEFSRGTLINMLTKGLNRSTVILSKFTVATVIWTLSYLICLAVCYFYTAYFWKMSGMHHVFLSFFSMWLFGVLLISLVLLGGVLLKDVLGSLLFAGGASVVMMLINIAPKLQKYNPGTLASGNMALLTAQKNISDFVPAVIICAAFIILFIAASIVAFNKKQM